MNTALKNLLINLALLAIVLLILFASTEMVFRVFYPQSSKSYVFDPLIGYRREPGVFLKRTGDLVVKKSVNALGFVDRERSLQKPKGTARVAIMGDSMTEALQIADDEDFQSVLEKTLNATGDSWEVINLGLSGQSTAQEYLTFKHYGLRFDPDIAIITMSITNDVSENAQEIHKTTDVPYVLIKNGDEVVIPPRNPTYGFPVDALRSSFHSFRWGMNSAYNLRRYVNRAFTRRVAPRTEQENEDVPPFFANFLAEKNDVWKKAWRITADIFKQIKKLAHQNEINLLVIIIPDRTQVYQSDWKEQLSNAQKEFPALENEKLVFDHEEPSRRARAMLADLGIPFIDFLDLFKAQKNEGRYLYVRGDTHLNRQGHAIVADALAAWILEHGDKTR